MGRDAERRVDEQGRFTALLGITSNDGLPLEHFSTEEARWLGIQVQGEAEQARVLLVSVPYALKAADAERLGGKPLSAFVLSESTDSAAVGESGEVPIDEPQALIDGTGTTNFVPKFNGSTVIGNSQIFDNGTNVGIGTTTPTNKLQVNGNIRLIGQTTHQVQVTGALSSGRLGQDANGFFFATDTPNKLLSFFTNAGAGIQRRVTITGAGDVGIGTEAPARKLHVAGQSGGLLIQDNATSPNIIGGFSGNAVSGGAIGATIAGGGQSGNAHSVAASFGAVGGGQANTAGNTHATVSGGNNNSAAGFQSTVGGGGFNSASATNATVGGGSNNTASAAGATVGGGSDNTASDLSSTVPGGTLNEAAAFVSLAAGRRAKANHQGAFVWGDSTNADVASSTSDQVTFRASGGLRVVVGATPDEVFSIDNNGNVEADGDVKLGPSAGLFAPGGVENLRILRGLVNTDGTVFAGAGF